MEQNKTTFTSVDEYILQFSPEVQEMLQNLRKVIKDFRRLIRRGKYERV